MLATLNLQFTPIEITDDSLMTSALTPDVAPIAEFADLLRLRVDAAREPGTSPGQMLPQGGSELPLQALPVQLEAPDAPELGVLPQLPAGTPVPQPEPAATPPGKGLTLEQPLPASLAVEPDVPVPAAPALNTPDLPAPVASGRELSPTAEPRPPATIQQSLPQPVTPQQVQETVIALSAKPEVNVPALREPPLPVTAQPVAVADVDKSLPIVELPRRVEASPLPVVNVEEISEVVKARPIVNQPVQVPNLQPNPQQPVVMPAAPTPVSTDTGFAAAVQQASDLIPVPVRDSAWAEQIGERVLLMAGKQMTSAEIRLTPAELGPLRVQVSVDDGAANVTFQAQHAVTREAIEQALPRLRELLAENGLSLGQASVGEQGVAEGKRDERPAADRSGAGELVDDADQPAEPQRLVASDSLVDTFV